eukprot:276235_1
MGNRNNIEQHDTNGELKAYQQLLCMGFDDEISWNASKKYKGNLNQCINDIIQQNKSQDRIFIGDNGQKKSNAFPSEYVYDKNDLDETHENNFNSIRELETINDNT